MKTKSDILQEMVDNVQKDVLAEIDLSFAIADKINSLMREKGLTKRQFADAIGKIQAR